MNDIKRTPPRVDAGPRIEAIKSYLKNNRATCKREGCGEPIFWCDSPNGKRIPMDFGTAHKATHILVPTAKDGVYLENELLALPDSHNPSHSCHLDSCRGVKR